MSGCTHPTARKEMTQGQVLSPAPTLGAFNLVLRRERLHFPQAGCPQSRSQPSHVWSEGKGQPPQLYGGWIHVPEPTAPACPISMLRAPIG